MDWRNSVTAQGQKTSPQPSIVALNSEQHRDVAFLKDYGWSFVAESPIQQLLELRRIDVLPFSRLL